MYSMPSSKQFETVRLDLKQANTEWFRGKFLALSLAQG